MGYIQNLQEKQNYSKQIVSQKVDTVNIQFSAQIIFCGLFYARRI